MSTVLNACAAQAIHDEIANFTEESFAKWASIRGFSWELKYLSGKTEMVGCGRLPSREKYQVRVYRDGYLPIASCCGSTPGEARHRAYREAFVQRLE